MTIRVSYSIMTSVCDEAGVLNQTLTALVLSERRSAIVAWLTEWWNQVWGTVLHGVEVTIVGMILVFFTLGLVIVSMVLLTKLPWLRAKVPTDQEPKARPEPAPSRTALPPPQPSPAQSIALEQVAAIAVALLLSRRRAARRARSGSAKSAWKSYGRAQQLGL